YVRPPLRSWVLVPEHRVVPLPAKKFPEVRDSELLSSSVPEFWARVPPLIVTAPFARKRPVEMLTVPPEGAAARGAVRVWGRRSIVPPETVVAPVTLSPPPRSRIAPPLWLKTPPTVSAPELTWMVALEVRVRWLIANVPETTSVAGLASDSVTSFPEPGTPSGFQLAASPQLVVPAPPSQVDE